MSKKRPLSTRAVDRETYLQQNLIGCFEETFRSAFTLPALSDFGTTRSYTYGEVAYRIKVIGHLFSRLGMEEGAKVAIYAKDTAHWCIAFMGTIANGAVVVPILSDFNFGDARSLINHSDAKVLFCTDSTELENLDPASLEHICCVIALNDFSVLYLQDENAQLREKFEAAMHDSAACAAFGPEEVLFNKRSNEELILINYTSGTTGFSKGVMLTGQNLAGNVLYAHRLDLMFRGDDILCFLPLAHAYSCAFNLLTPMTRGVHVVLLGKIPSPQILFKAFASVRPQLIITVPLIIEKIYSLAILPKLNKPAMRFAMAIPGVRQIIISNIRRRFVRAMGGRCREVIVGGAAMREEVAKFSKKAKFPLTVGYGMTECGPLIAYENHKKWMPGSCGKSLDNMEIAVVKETRADGSECREVWVRGMNVCKGYYKNPEANAQLFADNGWMRTGDLGHLDWKGNLFLQGRLKTMILTGSGQNIYPEEIESKIAAHPLVSESLVMLKKGKMIALVVIDDEAAKRERLSMEEARKRVADFRETLNRRVGAYERIARFIFRDEPFEKTPKRSIKRFLYEENFE